FCWPIKALFYIVGNSFVLAAPASDLYYDTRLEGVCQQLFKKVTGLFLSIASLFTLKYIPLWIHAFCKKTAAETRWSRPPLFDYIILAVKS
ncbi:hypothetical protein, partial [Selenomonas sp. KH1T6]|uniref:hypothetical protein n=1 Tax=Selenomonas sp. KH1T6 TaxID=3158784 RepID=UPI001C31C0A2